MSLRRIETWVLLVCVALAIVWFARSQPATRRAGSEEHSRAIPALAALPRGAALVVSADFSRVRQSALGRLLTGGGRELPGVGPLGEICGFDPTEQIREIALGAPEQKPERELELGVVATGDFARDRILECAAHVIAKRGGDVSHSQIGSFRTVRDRSRSQGEVAVREGGPVLLGSGSYLRDMVDAAEGRASTLLGDEAHSALRTAAGGRGAVLVTWIARPDWLARWLGQDAVEGSPLGPVRAGALRIEVSPDVVAVLLLTCPDHPSCQKLGAWAEGLTDGLRKAARESEGDDPVREAKIAVEDNAVRVTAAFDSARASRLLARLLLQDEPAPAASFEPDEVVRPKRKQ